MGVIIFIIVIVIIYNLLTSNSSSSSSSRPKNTYGSNPQNYNQNTNRTSVSSYEHLKKTESINNSYKKAEQVVQKIDFKPNPLIKFINSNEFGLYKWYSIYNYYPVNRFSQDQLSQIDINARRHVFNFKDGVSPKMYADLFASAMINKFGKEFLKGKILLIIPASNKSKTENRFSEFCQKLCEMTDMINGFSYLTNNDIVRNPAHNNGSRNYDVKQYLNLNYDISNKDVFVIDDVRTSGASSNGVYNLLNEKKAGSVTFIYLAKTVGIYI